MHDRPDVEAINLRGRLALLTSGDVRPITNLISADGLETDNPNEAVACVIKDSETHWITVAVSEFPTKPLQ